MATKSNSKKRASAGAKKKTKATPAARKKTAAKPVAKKKAAKKAAAKKTVTKKKAASKASARASRSSTKTGSVARSSAKKASPGAKSRPKAKRRSKASPKPVRVRAVEQKFEHLRDALARKQSELMQAYAAAKSDTRDRMDDGTEDYIDYAVNSYAKDFLLSLTELERQQLQLVREALLRLNRGEYGDCLQCGNEIPVKRLEVSPWVRYCIACQELEDQGLLPEQSFAEFDDESVADDEDDEDIDDAGKDEEDEEDEESEDDDLDAESDLDLDDDED
jgi:DnaK suppressor protein